jgi:hypothetical protein
MKTCIAIQRDWAMTRVDVMVIIAVLFVLGAFLSPLLAAAHRRAQSTNCASNLRAIGLTYGIWQRDHNGQYPMSVSVTNGGGMELIATGNIAGYFLTMTDYLSTAIFLSCPADSRVVGIPPSEPISVFPHSFNNSNISYFVGLNADKSHPHALLFGDDNFAIGDGVHPHPIDNSAVDDTPVKSGISELLSNAPIWWTGARHEFVGNVAFGNGSVQQTSSVKLQEALQETAFATNRLVIP